MEDEARNTVGKGLECPADEFVTEFPMVPEQALSEIGEILMVI